MAKVLSTAYAHVTGGRDGNAKTADGALELNLRVPTEIGGSGGGTNPEELFAVGYAACFESALARCAPRCSSKLPDSSPPIPRASTAHPPRTAVSRSGVPRDDHSSHIKFRSIRRRNSNDS
jgi:organic hydroperoxide reductase OsmC/OhrA